MSFDEWEERERAREARADELLKKMEAERAARAARRAPPKPGQAQVGSGFFCEECGWNAVVVFCNDGMSSAPPYSYWDWWAYCSNKTCRNHSGSGYFQDLPGWVYISNP